MRIPVGERSALNAWWLPADSRQPVPAVLLYLRGNDGNLGQEVDRLHALHRYGFPILAIDYRGYGRSSGPPPSEAQVYEDAMAGWDYLVRALDTAPGHIVIYGHSLGGAVATELALRRGPACGVVLEATFTSMSEIARLEYPWIPVDWLLHERFDTLIKISRLDLPMVLVHGTADDEVPPTMTERCQRRPRRQTIGDGQRCRARASTPMAGEPMVQAMAELARVGAAKRFLTLFLDLHAGARGLPLSGTVSPPMSTFVLRGRSEQRVPDVARVTPRDHDRERRRSVALHDEKADVTVEALRTGADIECSRMQVERTPAGEDVHRVRPRDRPGDATGRDIEQRAAGRIERIAPGGEIGKRFRIAGDEQPRAWTEPQPMKRARTRRRVGGGGSAVPNWRCAVSAKALRARSPCTFQAVASVAGQCDAVARRAMMRDVHEGSARSSATKTLAFRGR